MKARTTNRSHTKAGPGRTHGQCKLIIDPTSGDIVGVRKTSIRRAPTVFGGHWKGAPYLSYAEHDRCVRAGMADVFSNQPKAVRRLQRDGGYNAERNKILASR
jgi:hypothetical protein